MIMGTPHMTSTKTHEDLNVLLDNTVLERAKFTKFLGAHRGVSDMEKSHRLYFENYITKYWCHEQT